MIKIVAANERHLDAVVRMEQECFSMPWTREQLETQLDESRYIFLAAEDEQGSALGYVGLMYVLDEGYISNIAVMPEHRREGIADMLLDELKARAQEKRLAFMTLEVRKSNNAARKLYEKHGYREVGLSRNHYSRPLEDAVLMTCFLSEE